MASGPVPGASIKRAPPPEGPVFKLLSQLLERKAPTWRTQNALVRL